MADDTEDLTPFMEHGADYVAAKGAAGAFDPATYGPKQDVKQLPAWMRDATIAPPGVVDALNDAPTDGSKSGSSKFDDILNFMREQQQQTQAEGRATLDEEKRGIRSGIEEIDKQRRSLMATPYPTPQRAPTPPRVDAQAGMQWAQAAALLGAMAGGFVRRGSTDALTAFAAANKGFAQGNQQAFENATAEWKLQAEQVKDDNQARLDQYNAIIKQKGKNIDLILGELKLAAQAWNDEMMFNAANSKQTQMIGAMLQKEQEHQDMMEYRFGNQDLANRKLQAQLKAGVIGGRGNAGQLLNKWVQEESEKGHVPTEAEMQKKMAQINASLSYGSSAGRYSSRVEQAANEAEAMIPQAIETSRAVPRGTIVQLNKLVQSWKQGTSDPALNDFLFANWSVVNEYARALNPTGTPHTWDKIEMEQLGILATTTSQQAYEGQLRRMWKEIQAARAGTAKTLSAPPSDVDQNAPFPGDTMAPPKSGQGGGSNVDPWNDITDFKVH